MTGAQYRQLKRLAHDLKPVVMVGKQGVTATLVASVRDALDTHELIKIRFVDHKDQRNDLSADIARSTESELVGVIGNVATFYRQHPDPEKRKIVLK